MNAHTKPAQPSGTPNHCLIEVEVGGPLGMILALAVLERLAPNLYWVWPIGLFDRSGNAPLDLRTSAARQTITNPVVDRDDACASLVDWAMQICAPIYQS